ncbi:MAG: carbamoyltransferase HypF [Planctomycetes bacterium]|nr:carbamoyltransferase HypF [Planctomycetota bacterium]
MERHLIRIAGIVQGVGFRPYVQRLAARLDLGGFVRNQAGEVLIEVEGQPRSLAAFQEELTRHPPLHARIDSVSCRPTAPVGDRTFRIDPSKSDSEGLVLVCPDLATCSDCLAELFDPADRRHKYPFLNCTACGPRLTIIGEAPYDRCHTTMARFSMCPACRAEYDDPADRRFHAQATACPVCGPAIRLLNSSGKQVAATDPFQALGEALRSGRIAAVKGLGGYHLVCDASNANAVAELRRRKHRDEKPFAIMLANIDTVRCVCEVNSLEAELLTSPQAPIVLLRRRSSALIAESVAPKNPRLGVLLPNTPVHHLLADATGGIPLVMTSGNRSDEPIAQHDDEALARLRDIADCFLVHDRPIAVRCDDSVTQVVRGCELPVRRSRGYAPAPIELPMECPCSILAVGGQLKATFALGNGRQAILSHHLGDLDHLPAYRAFERDAELYQKLFGIRPACIAHDLHPSYASTRYAMERSASEGVTLVPVQHHHAHLASCMAEHGLSGPVIGVIFDGTGFGTDGAIWGGEFLVGDYQQFRRAAHLRYVGLPGGEQAIREPWRMAAAHLLDAECGTAALQPRIPTVALRTVVRMLQRRVNSPATSSVGRLFDAVASMIGLRDRVSYEAQAAMELEWLASESPPDGVYAFGFEDADCTAAAIDSPPLVIDTRPLLRALTDDVRQQIDPAIIARRFHSTLVEMICAACERIAKATGIRAVVLSGGVFLNVLLISEAVEKLSASGFNVFRHQLVPPNDGGLSLGQLAIAAMSMHSHRPNPTR